MRWLALIILGPGTALAKAACNEWCVEVCSALNGDPVRECGGCPHTGLGCHPGAAGFPDTNSEFTSAQLDLEVAPRGHVHDKDGTLNLKKCEKAMCLDEGGSASKRWSMTNDQARCETLAEQGWGCTWGTWDGRQECRTAVCKTDIGIRCAKHHGMRYVCSENK